jgi:predicted nucleotidyltransferase
VGDYEALIESTIALDVWGIECSCLDLDRLIAVKRAAGRRKDFDAIAELEATRDES